MGFLIFLLLGGLVVLLVAPIIALVRANRALSVSEDRFRYLLGRVEQLEQKLAQQEQLGRRPVPPEESVREVQERPQAPPSPPQRVPEPLYKPSATTAPAPYGIPSTVAAAAVARVPDSAIPHVAPAAPPPSPSYAPRPLPPIPSVNWEHFLGARLYAWIGGLALFLAVAFFVKYSFEQGWLPPELRVALGFALGIGLLVGGVFLRRKEYTITSHTLGGTGILVLYGVTFACRAIYQFTFFGPLPTFGLMSLITVVAFVVAVRLDALVVAVLGMLGGFLTPILLSTGQDAPVALFSYIALLDAGLLGLVWRRRWAVLAPLAAAGTVLMLVGWAGRFFAAGQYFEGTRTLIPMGILVGFNLMWLAATWITHHPDREERWLSDSAAGLTTVAFLFGLYFQSFTALAERPGLLLSYLFVIDAIALGLSHRIPRLAPLFPAAGAMVFAQLALWMSTRVTADLLPAALVFTLIFAVAHAGWPLAQQRITGSRLAPPRWSLLVPPVALVILLIPTFRLVVTPLVLWPVILLVDVVAVVLAGLSRSLLPVLVSLALTLLATVGSVVHLPTELTGLPSLLGVIGLCAVFFAAAGIWLKRRIDTAVGTDSADPLPLTPELLSIHVSLATALPFVLLVLIVVRLPLASPSPVFGLALLLTGMLLVLGRMFRVPWLPVVALGSVVALEHAWHLRQFQSGSAGVALGWYLLFLGVFAVHPFVRRREVERDPGPWVAAALAGPVQFYLIHQVVKTAWPNPMMGLLAAAFALPPVASLTAVRRLPGDDNPNRATQLALFGGATLFFITLIFPLQFSRQWITLSWALEGAALCWLFHRIPHPGLRITGVGLLVTAFVRLALNPAVLSYHPRSATPILNWYLYTYGIATVAMFVAARLLAPPRDRVLNANAPAVLNTLGTILAFLLLNLQIADFFTVPGQAVLTFQFSGNFARDMTYSIGWALFALVLLIGDMVRRLAAARYAALVLLGVTILKLFLHDLSRLGTPYRIGALAAVAVVALAASFLYQRFVANPDRPDEPPASHKPS